MKKLGLNCFNIILIGFVISVLPAYKKLDNYKNIEIPASLSQQLKDGWHLINIDKGDLNKDGIDDYAIVVEADVKSNHKVVRFSFPDEPPYIRPQNPNEPPNDRYVYESYHEPRELQVFFGQADGEVKHVFSHSHWIDRSDFGGIYGDSFNGIWVKDGKLTMSGYGGGTPRWSWDLAIRFEDDKWRLVGYSTTSYDPFERIEDTVSRDFLINVAKIERHQEEETLLEKWDNIYLKTKIYLVDSRPTATFAK